MKLSIIIPVYNEKETLPLLFEKVKGVDLGSIKKEIILVDDFSSDGTKEWITRLKDKSVKKVFHDENLGKGAAVRDGIKISTGDVIIIQDADLEYNPEEYPLLIDPILKKEEKVVYGSRALKKDNEYSYLSFYMGGKIVTSITNFLFFSKLTDEPTCYKTFSREIIKNINIDNNRFEWEPEVTAKILKKGVNIHEVPISYTPRDREHGKKINWKDGLAAIWTLFKYRFKN